MIFSQIQDGVIVNTIVLNDIDDLPLFMGDFDYVLQIDQLYPRPGIGWTFDGITFSPPEPSVSEESEDSGEEE